MAKPSRTGRAEPAPLNIACKTLFVCAILPLLLVCQHAPAQDKGPADVNGNQEGNQSLRGHPIALFTLLAKPVHEELRLSEGQLSRIADLATSYARASHPQFRKLRELRDPSSSMSPEARADLIGEIRKTLNEASEKHDQLAVEILDAAQSARLKQLMMQARGVWLLFDPATREQLQITESQRERISKLVQECEDRCQEIAQQARLQQITPQTAMKNVSELRREAREKAREVLTTAQLAQLDEMLGPKPAYEPTELRVRLMTRRKER